MLLQGVYLVKVRARVRVSVGLGARAGNRGRARIRARVGCTQRKNEARSGARKAWVASLVLPEAPPAVAVTWYWGTAKVVSKEAPILLLPILL